jgi:hypothetical protein
MGRERRKSQRRILSYPAAIYRADGSIICNCLVHDFSENGARLKMEKKDNEPAIDVPPEFVLSFTSDGDVFRRCQMIWNREGEVGVKFSSHQKKRKLD